MQNMKNWRTIFIWDIHWCYKEFKLLLKKINLTPEDKVYLTWDFINRWPKSYKILKFLFNNKEQFKSVIWNHEMYFLNWIEWKKYNYEKKHFFKLKDKIEKYPEFLDYLKKLPKYIETNDFILIHWWLLPKKTINEHTINEITETKDVNWIPWYNYYSWNKKIIYWHWGIDWLRIRKNTIWIETGCVYWKWLTAYILETWEVYQQSSLDIYINVYKNENNWIKKIKKS